MKPAPCPYCGHPVTAHYTYGCVLTDETGTTCRCSAPPPTTPTHGEWTTERDS